MSENSKPIASLNFPTSGGGQIQVAIWENEHQKGDESFTFHNCTFQRRYYDEETKTWKSASGFRSSDLLALAFAAQEAYRHIAQEKQ